MYSLTKVTSKQLLPIYDKPMIYYLMSVLMNVGIRDILIVSTPQDTPCFENLLGDGYQFDVNLTYAVQPSPDGLSQAFIIGANFIGNDSVAMVLGDNIFAGHGLKKRLNAAVEKAENGQGATVFGYRVNDFWHPNDEGGMAWNDPEIGIEWPELKGEYKGSASTESYTLEDGTARNLSDKDQKWLRLKDTFKF